MTKIYLHKSYSGIIWDEDEELWWMEFLAADDEGQVFDYVIMSEEMEPLYAIDKHFKSPTLEPYTLEIPNKEST